MQHFFSTVLIAASAVSVVAAGLAFSSGTHAQDVRMTSLTFIEHATTDTVIDTGAKGDSSGDLLTFSNEVFDAQDKEKVGTDSGWCIRIVAGKSWECFWTLAIADGQITVEGPFLDAGDSALAVTGGTGKYAGARGEMALHPRDAKGSAYDFKYNLMQ